MHLDFSGTPEKVELDLWELEPKSCFLRVSLTHGVGAKLRNNVTVAELLQDYMAKRFS